MRQGTWEAGRNEKRPETKTAPATAPECRQLTIYENSDAAALSLACYVAKTVNFLTNILGEKQHGQKRLL